MCLGIPYEVVEVQDDDSCLVRVGSGVQHCFTGLVERVRPGDWLVVHAGFAVERINEEDARENLALITRYIFGDEDELTAQAREGMAEARTAAGSRAGDGDAEPRASEPEPRR